MGEVAPVVFHAQLALGPLVINDAPVRLITVFSVSASNAQMDL